MKKSILLLLLPILYFTNCFSQTWPTKDCPDKPYTKGNDGIIYHTCDCGVRRVTDSFFYLGLDTTAVSHTWKYYEPPTTYSPISDKSFFSRTVYSRNGHAFKTINHYDSLVCPACHNLVPKSHIQVRIDAGMIVNKLDKNGQFILTPLGKYDLLTTEWRSDPSILPPKLAKYVPKDYTTNKRKYRGLLITE